MRVFNEDKSKELDRQTLDLTKGYFRPDEIITHHEAIQEIPEEGHYDVIKEYPNGGRDVEWIVDKPGRKAREAYDEKEDIEIYIPYPETEYLNQQKQEAIKIFTEKLTSSDYKILKYLEGDLSQNDYENIVRHRQLWRANINEIEAASTLEKIEEIKNRVFSDVHNIPDSSKVPADIALPGGTVLS